MPDATTDEGRQVAEQDQVIRLLATVIAQRGPGASLPGLLCRRAMDRLGADAVAATLLSAPEHRHVVFASDQEVLAVEDVQFLLGDGPVIEAYRDDRPVLVADLGAEPPDRWPMFGEAYAHDAAYGGVCAFPLRLGDAGPVGVLGLYRRGPGGLDREAVADAKVVARALAVAVVRQSAADPEEDDYDRHGVGTTMTSWSVTEQVVHQAVGMVVAQLRLGPYEALARLRAHAFATGTTLDDVAMAVVERRVRLEE